MKKLFCVVVTDPNDEVGLESPWIFHISCADSDQAEEKSKELLSTDHEYSEENIESLDFFSFELRDLDIIEI